MNILGLISQLIGIKTLRLTYSIHRMKMYKDKGSPCLIPLDGEKSSSRSVLTRISKDEEDMQDIIKSIQDGGKWKN